MKHKRVHLRSLCNFFSRNHRGIRGIITEYLPWLLIALAVLVVLMITILVMKQQGETLIDKIKNIFSGR